MSSPFKKYINKISDESTSTSTPQASSSAASAAPTSTPASKPATSKPAASSPSSAVAATNGRNVLSSDVEIKGKIKFSNDLVVDGLVDGEIASDGSLTVGENARVKAEISTRSVVIYGKVHGNIQVTERVELKASAELVGDIKAATISIEAGAIFVGKSSVGAPSIKNVAPTKANSANAKNLSAAS